jgi:shikimate kinase
MNITITGPRSVGKSTISKLVAKKLKLKYISSDEIGEKALKGQGGLDGTIKSGKINGFIISRGAYSLIKEVYSTKNNFVFDLSGGSISTKKFGDASKEVREIAKNNSYVIGLLPSKNLFGSIFMLFQRELKREHFKSMNKLLLFRKVVRNYLRFPFIFKNWADGIVYTKTKSPEQISNEIIGFVKK